MILLYWTVRFLISLRYRIEIKGLEKIKGEKKILFLPNHPAEIDPVIIMLVLWRKYRPRPLIVESFFSIKPVAVLLNLVRCMPIPDLNGTTSKWKLAQIEKRFEEVITQLGQGENFLIYPSGKLKVGPMESIGGASFTANLIKACPDAEIVLMRTSGLWGSSFSRALTGQSPDLSKTLLQGMKIILKNGIFFTPRRKVTIELENAPSDFPKNATRLEINRYLENWYNKKGPEPLTLVPYYFWKKELPKIAISQEMKGVAATIAIPKEIEDAVLTKIATLARRPKEQVKREMNLSTDLGLDSLDVAQVVVFLDERYHIAEIAPGSVQTVADVLQIAAGFKKVEKSETQAALSWPEEAHRLTPLFPEGKTIQEVFLNTCKRMGKQAACMDATSGILSYRKLRIAAQILSLKIQEMPGDKIGILLPSSVGAYLLILAILFAKKTPVMFNWTVGSRALDHCLKMSGVKAALSSRRFLERLEYEDLGGVLDKLVLLEEVRSQISLWQKLRGLFLKPKIVAKEDDPAVILFTSGTETLPKGVPLSHKNLLENQRAALSCVSINSTDSLYGVLPPFHSYGFSVTGILPLLMGLRVCYAPDPTDSHGLAADIATWKPTLFCCAPSFISALFKVADPQALKSLRLIVSGADKAPPDLFSRGYQIIEGYGITECGPIVTIERPGEPHIGVGRPIPGVELKIIEEEIYIHGPSVFSGYLGNTASPFVEIEGKRYYRSGDLGSLTKEGVLILSGRKKRFIKIGAEMVGLNGLEEELMRLSQEKKWVKELKEGPALAISAKEGDKTLIILFTTFDISKEEVNDALRECGYGRIIKIAEVKKLEQIPTTATGKTHYRRLDELC